MHWLSVGLGDWQRGLAIVNGCISLLLTRNKGDTTGPGQMEMVLHANFALDRGTPSRRTKALIGTGVEHIHHESTVKMRK